MSKPSILFVVLLLLPVTLPAQPVAPGDWIVAAYSGLLKVNPLNGGLTPIGAATSAYSFHNWVMMDRDNSGFATALASDYYTTPGNLVRLNSTGTQLGSVYVNSAPNAIDVDQDGSYLVTTFASSVGGLNALYRVNGSLTSSTLVAMSSGGYLNAMCVDQENGDYILGKGNFSGGTANSGLYRVNRVTGALTTIVSGLGDVNAVDFEPRTGSFVVCRSNAPGLIRVSRLGAVTTATPSSLFSTYCNAVKVDDETGNLLVATSNGLVGQVSPAGSVLSSFFLSGQTLAGIEKYGSRKVSGSGPATAGSTYTVQLAFPQSPNLPYIAALSLGQRPGLALPDGRVINVNVNDQLFLVSAGGIAGITTGFQGVLNGQGRATATINIPAGTPAGVRIFVTAVALNPALGSSLDTANTVGFTTN